MQTLLRRLTRRSPSLLLAVFLLLAVTVTEATAQALPLRVVPATRVNTSERLRDMPAARGVHRVAPYVVPNKLHDFNRRVPAPDRTGFVDPVLDADVLRFSPGRQERSGGSFLANFDGASDVDNTNVVGFPIVPPDTNGDVGPNHYVQWINVVAEIFDKNGNSLMGPFAGNQFFQGLGGNCEAQNDGDPIALYDHLADRWVVLQFMIGATPNSLCVAVSATPDPTGAYHQYEFPFEGFPDYPKLGVWPDAYYASTVSFTTGGSYQGAEAVAFERDRMLQGQPAQMVLAFLPNSDDLLLPADLDGPAPPAGFAGVFAGLPIFAATIAERERVRLYEMAVDWANPMASTFTALPAVPTAPYGLLSNRRNVIPQPGTTWRLDAISDRLMHRLQYRNFGTHQTLVTNHTVNVGGTSPDHRAGVRWYELRNAGSGWGMYQQGTYAPDDGLHRWMGSVAMNGDGEIALGYSVSSGTLFPSIRYAAQTTDGSGTGLMNVPETEIHAGTGSQTGSGSRWGDYSMMSVDPADDETFWYTQEYYETTGSFDFKTRIAAFTIDSPPVIAVAEKPLVLWPPNGKHREINVADFVVDVGDDLSDVSLADVYVTRVSSDEAENGDDDGNTTDDITLNGCQSFNVRVERSGVGDGRVYTVEVAAEDEGGNVGTASFEVWVPVSRNGNAENDGAAYTLESGCSSPTALIAGAVAGTSREAAGERAGTAAARTDSAVPTEVTLGQNYPNPFRGSTVVEFGLPERGEVALRVYDVTGRAVAVLAEGGREAGYHRAAFDASGLSSGLYVVVLEAEGARQIRRMTLLR